MPSPMHKKLQWSRGQRDYRLHSSCWLAASPLAAQAQYNRSQQGGKLHSSSWLAANPLGAQLYAETNPGRGDEVFCVRRARGKIGHRLQTHAVASHFGSESKYKILLREAAMSSVHRYSGAEAREATGFTPLVGWLPVLWVPSRMPKNL